MIAAIRIKGTVGVKKEIKDTLKMLRLDKLHNCVILPETKDVKGMLNKAKDWITWGEISKETLIHLLKKRLKFRNGKKVREEDLKKITGFDTFEKFADALMENKVKLKNFEKLQPKFRLTPPSKGFKNKKSHWPKGDLGYRGEAINELLKRMI